MLSGAKCVPRDQALSSRAGGGGVESDSDGSECKRRDKRDKGKEDKKRRRNSYSSHSKDGSDTDDSISDEEEDVSWSKRRWKHRRRSCRDFSDDGRV